MLAFLQMQSWHGSASTQMQLHECMHSRFAVARRVRRNTPWSVRMRMCSCGCGRGRPQLAHLRRHTPPVQIWVSCKRHSIALSPAFKLPSSHSLTWLPARFCHASSRKTVGVGIYSCSRLLPMTQRLRSPRVSTSNSLSVPIHFNR